MQVIFLSQLTEGEGEGDQGNQRILLRQRQRQENKKVEKKKMFDNIVLEKSGLRLLHKKVFKCVLFH